MSSALVVSIVYIVVAVTLTFWLAGSLYRNGIELLRERDDQHPALAEATSRLLVIGFSLFTLGYAFLLLQVRADMEGVEALQFLIQRLGILLVSLGLIHLFNTLVFLRFRRSRAAEIERDESARRRSSRREGRSRRGVTGSSDEPPPDAPPSERARAGR